MHAIELVLTSALALPVGATTASLSFWHRYDFDTSGVPHFSDVPAANPFYPFVETAYNHGVVNGYADGTFRWAANVTRGQLSKIVVGARAWAINTSGGPHFG